MPLFKSPDGVSLFYKDWGAGAPVVFVHTFIFDADSWSPQMAFLSAHGVRCIAFDRRGHGRSDDPGTGYDFDTLADDLGALLEHLDLTGVTLVGHSMGCGEIARYLARHGSGRVSRALLVAPITPCMARKPDNPAGMDPAKVQPFRAAMAADFPRALRTFAPVYWGEGETASAEMRDWGHQMALRTSLLAVLSLTDAIWQTDFRADLRAFDVPTLIVQGDRDESTPLASCGEPTAAAIPGSRLVVYEGVPHALPLVARERFNHDLLAFAAPARA